MTCKRVTFLLTDYLARELNNEPTLMFEEHLLNCPDFVAFLSTYKKTIQATQSLRCENMPADVEKWVRNFLREKINDAPHMH